MSLMRQTFQPTFARMLLAVALICALLVSQFGLSRHVIEHAASPLSTAADSKATTANTPLGSPDTANCLTCLEHQAHGTSLISSATVFVAESVNTLALRSLAPNTPYLSPERASQRAPPVLS